MATPQISALGAVGVITDSYGQDIPPHAWTSCRNVRFGPQGARAFNGQTQVFATENGSGAPITPLWIKYFPDKTNPRWAYADNNNVYCIDNGTHYKISRVAGGAYGAVDRWQGTLFNGLGILNNGFDIPQVWGPIAGATPLIDLANWPTGYRCRFIKPFKEFLIAGHIYDGSVSHPHRILWSHPADPGTVPASWNVADATKDAGDFEADETPDAVVDGLQMGDQFCVYRENSIWAMQLTGDSQIMRKYRISDKTGAVWKDCVVDIPPGHVVAGWEDVILHQGSEASVRSLLDKRTRKWLVANQEVNYLHNAFIVPDMPEKEVWYCFPTLGYQYANLAMVINWGDGQVGFRDLPNVPFADAGPILLAA